MNQLPCEVVRDLLPSYVDGLTGDITNELVRQHLDSCPDCLARRTAMGASEAMAQTDAREIDFLKKNRRKNRRVILWSMLGTALLAIALVLIYTFLIGTKAAPDILACRAAVEDETRLTLTGDITDSLHVVSGIRFRQEGGTVYATVRTAMPGLLRGDGINGAYAASQKITQVVVNGRIVWEDGISISPLTARIFETRHNYIGDMPANMATAQVIGIADTLGTFTNSLETSARPYRWTLEFPVKDSVLQTELWEARNANAMLKYGVILLATIDNLDEVAIRLSGDGFQQVVIVSSQRLAETMALDVKTAGKTAAGLQRLLDSERWQQTIDTSVFIIVNGD